MRALICFFWASLSIVFAHGAAATDLCQDPRIPPPGKGGRCEAYSLRYADGDTETEVLLAKVFRRMAQDYDFFFPEFEHYLQRPDGEIVSLGQFRQLFSNKMQRFLLNGLRIHAASAGGTLFMDWRIFFDQRLDRLRDPQKGDRYCMRYQMKLPFQGIFQDCEGSEIVADIGYAPGTTTWLEAIQRACAEAAPNTDRPCRNASFLFNVIKQDADGTVYYVVAVRREPDYLIYRIDTKGGAVTLLRQTLNREELRRWTTP